MPFGRQWLPVAIVGLGLFVFFLGTYKTRVQPEELEGGQPSLELIWPEPIAVLMAGGDPYLAANLKIIRGMVSGTTLTSQERKRRFAYLMETGMRINGAHADGYYLAHAILPWEGYLRLDQEIQRRASQARPWDWLPPFFRGFNFYYFKKDPSKGALVLRKAANRVARRGPYLKALAAHWSALGHDPKEALRLIRVMQESTRSKRLWLRLRKREEQLEGLIRLRKAAEAYRETHGKPPASFKDLIGHGGLESVPNDPLGEGFVLKSDGSIRIQPPRALTQEPHKP